MKKLVFIIAGIDIVLLAVCMFLYLGKDRTAPVISFGENAVSYEEGMDERLLLQGCLLYTSIRIPVRKGERINE